MKKPALTAFLMALAGACLMYEPVFQGLVFYQRDIYNYWRPHIDWVLTTLARGEWVGWNPGLQFGMPFLSDPNFQMFYPPTWVLLLLPPDLAYSLMVIGHAAFGGLGVALLLRSLGLPRGASTGALVFALSGPLVSMANLWHHYCGAAWIPWVVWAARRLGDSTEAQPSWRLFASLLGLQALAGSAESVVMSLGFVVLTQTPNLRTSASLRRLGLACVVAGGLAAIQWLPTTLLFRSSARKEFAAATKLSWSLPPRLAYQLVVAGDPRTRQALFDTKEAPLDDSEVPFIMSPYLGAFALPLAVVGARLLPGHAALLVATLLAALGKYLPGGLPLLLTILPFRYPTKVLALSAVLFAVLSGAGAHALLERPPAEKRRFFAVVLAMLAAGAGAAVSLPGDPSSRLARSALFLAAGLLVPLAERRAIPALLAAGVVIDACTGLSWVNEYAEASLYRYRPPAAQAALSLKRSPRVFAAYPGEQWAQADLNLRGMRSAAAFQLSLGEVVYPPHGIRFGLRHGFHPDFSGLGVKEMVAFEAFLDKRFRSDVRRYLSLGAIDAVISTDNTNPLGEPIPFARFPGMMSSPVRVDLWGRTSRAGLATRVWVTHDVGAAMEAVSAPSFEPAVDVAVDDPQGREGEKRELAGGSAAILADRTDRVEVEVQANGPGLLVLRDSLREGWTASVNGQRAPILRADVLFRGVAVPAGRSLVVFSYTTPGLPLGAFLCVMSLLVLAAPRLKALRR